MFESDDFDLILSQYDLPHLTSTFVSNDTSNSKAQTVDIKLNKSLENVSDQDARNKTELQEISAAKFVINNTSVNINSSVTNLMDNDSPVVSKEDNSLSTKHKKRKVLNSLFHQDNKRKFPGPAGLLSGHIEQSNSESINHIELLSQDIDFSHHQKDLFEAPIWKRLLCDLRDVNTNNIDTIKSVKQQALAGNLRRKKAQTVIGVIESVDRSVADPLVVIRDSTGPIQCTLHRDAWAMFSPYIMSEYCALILWRPTVLTTGNTAKKHYLNITLSNIHGVYSSAIYTGEDPEFKDIPDGFSKVCEEQMTIIRTKILPHYANTNNENSIDILNELDSIFADESF